MENEMFTEEQYKTIFESVRYYQINYTALNGKQYKICDEILTKLFSKVYTQKQEQTT